MGAVSFLRTSTERRLSVVAWALPVGVAMRWLTTSIYGALTWALITYWLFALFSDSTPFGLRELMLWVDDLPMEAKTALLTALLTIMGFMIAFQTATANWKAQEVGKITIGITTEVSDFYNEALRDVTSLKLQAKYLLRANRAIEDGDEDAAFRVSYAVSEAASFTSTRAKLSAMAVESYGIVGRHSVVLALTADAPQTLNECAERLNTIAKSMWIHYPVVFTDNSDEQIAHFHRQIDVEKIDKFIQDCEDNYSVIMGLVGAVRGVLLGPIVGFNMNSARQIFAVRGDLGAVFNRALAKKVGKS